MEGIVKKLAIICALMLPAAVAAQTIQMQQQVQGGPGGRDTAERPKPTAEMQARGSDLLQMAEAGAAGLDPGMRAFSQLQIARGYVRTDKKKAVELMENAWAASRSIDDDKIKTRAIVQSDILNALIPLAPDSAEQHVTEMDAGFQKNGVLTKLLGYYEKNNQIGRAEQMIYRIGSSQEIPYAAVQRIIEALPAEQNADVPQLFAASLASYRNHKHTDSMNAGGDFPDLIVKTWKRVPPQMVHEGIDEVLQQADPANNSSGKSQPFSMSMVSDKGAVAFNSMYQWRLFQLLPVLRQIDADEADQLLKKAQDVQTLLDKYPNGTDSLNPPGEGDKDKGHGSMNFSMGSSGGARAQGGPSPMEMQRVMKIMTEAEKNPAEALTNAQSISDPKMKVGVLRGIARAAAKKDPATARSALGKMVDALPQLDNPTMETQSLAAAAEIDLLMGEEQDAKKMVEQGLKAADKLYKSDSSGDDPNQALEAYWPSSAAYRDMLRLAGRISPVWAVGLIKDLPDNSVKVMAETSLAAAWLDLPQGATTIMSATKKGTSMQMSMEGPDDEEH